MATPAAITPEMISPRTLRRVTQEGLVRPAPGRRRRSLPAAEVEYLRRHWVALAALRRALRTERSVATAVVFGSFARGDDTPTSDVDLAVLSRGPAFNHRRLRENLSIAAGRRVDLVDWDTLHQAPEMELAVATDGRPLVDRVGAFPAIRAQRENARRRAARLRQRQWQAIERLWGG
jgi:predicted nucleotidyltransferase